MRISVVIPTHNRKEILKECLLALFGQDFKKSDYEIIIVDDGSTDYTPDFLKRMQKKSPVDFSFHVQKNSGQGVARNLAVKHAKGDIVLLIGDDIIATPQLLREHNRVHAAYPEENAAVLGFITWHPKIEITPLMRFMEKGGAIFGRFGGHQFAFDLLEGKETADYRFFYTSNISLKRPVLLNHKFDPWFSGYGWEDIELGHRLTKKIGLTLFYEPLAVAYHKHPMDFADFKARMRSIGRSVPLIAKKYPELGLLPSERKKNIWKLLARPVALSIFKSVWRDMYYYTLSKKYFLQGMRSGYNGKGGLKPDRQS